MKYNVISYFLVEGFRNVFKNKKSTISCLVIMCLTMIVFGIFFAIGNNINHIMDNVKEAQGMQVFLKADATEEEIETAKKEILSIDGVKTAEYISKDEAINIMRNRLKDRQYVMDGINKERFSVSYVVTLEDLEMSSEVQEKILALDNIKRIQSRDETISTLISIGNGINIFTFAILVVLVVVSLFIISNTIKLTVHARRKEISIMKYVGATNNFIRAPFIVEGIIIGVMAGFISVLIICLGYNLIANQLLQSSVAQTIELSLLSFTDMSSSIIIVYAILGIGIGIIGSAISMRKYLDV